MVLTPFQGSQWNYEKAAHLLNRIGFGGTPADIESVHAQGLDAILRQLVDSRDEPDKVPAPPWAHPQNLKEIRAALQALKEGSPERKEKMREMQEMQAAQILDLRYWWLKRMMTARNPLREKMTLFWHGHFATSIQKVNNCYWMWLQNETFRRNALGNFKSLTRQISRDPAMMIYLDLQESRKEHPNENWARELMELFTAGIGHYTEEDIRESARAFTGYRLDNTTQDFQFAANQHDNAQKTFMGKTGAWDGDDVIDILMEKPACSEFIAAKLWRFFVEDPPPQKIVSAVANRLRAEKYEIRPVLREIFSSAEFFSESAMHSHVKSPVEFLLQTTKLLESELPPPKVAQNAMVQMGQLLFAPPNVKGWDGGLTWISPSTLLFRYNFAGYLASGDIPATPKIVQQTTAAATPAALPHPTSPPPPPRRPINVTQIAPPELRGNPDVLVARLVTRVFQRQLPRKQLDIFKQFLVSSKLETSDRTIRALLHLMMSTPEFQLT
ncbi:MAG: DUF1800 domain-containing protein [Acidobacteriales bacterium]|nr:DUF1800 domain-containing protein [Terriglobales bacterium]